MSADAERLAAGFSVQASRWAFQAGASPAQVQLARQLARALSLAVSAGHSCVPLARLRPMLVAARAEILATGIVGTADAPGSFPLILDADDRLYLHRYFDYELRLARRVQRAMAPACAAPLPESVAACLDALFDSEPASHSSRHSVSHSGDPASRQPDWQKLAAALAVLRRFTLISGGPGTGKTSTVVKLLACLLTLDPDAQIVLAAPTGKAAARMLEAVRERASVLPEAVRIRLPTTASTVHRLLGVDFRSGRYRYHADHLLSLDVLVVDEASMLDLALATRLFEAVPDHARIIVLGDKDQLAAVESGAVFAELSAGTALGDATCADLAQLTGIDATAIRAGLARPAADPAGVRDSVIWFGRQFRFGAASALGRLASAVRAGEADAALAVLCSPSATSELQWLPATPPEPDPAQFGALCAGYEDYWASLESWQAPEQTFAAFQRFRLLCALRSGPWGADALTEQLSRHARHRLDAPADGGFSSVWYRGRPVMVLRNDPILQLFNGDIGIALPNADGELEVCFPASDGRVRWIAPVRLPAHETAYAMTIHKSQGSEFDRAAIVLPPAPSPLLTRELIYTGITRARLGVVLIANEARLRDAILTPTERDSGLLARLAEAATARS